MSEDEAGPWSSAMMLVPPGEAMPYTASWGRRQELDRCMRSSKQRADSRLLQGPWGDWQAAGSPSAYHALCTMCSDQSEASASGVRLWQEVSEGARS